MTAPQPQPDATPWPALLGDEPRVHFDVVVAWGEMDALGHVNNVAYFRYIESARVDYLRRLGVWQREGRPEGFILQSASIRFRRPVFFPDTLRVSSRAEHVGEDRFTLAHTLRSVARGEVVALGQSVIVAYDYARAAKTPLPADLREAIRALDGPGEGP